MGAGKGGTVMLAVSALVGPSLLVSTVRARDGSSSGASVVGVAVSITRSGGAGKSRIENAPLASVTVVVDTTTAGVSGADSVVACTCIPGTGCCNESRIIPCTSGSASGASKVTSTCLSASATTVIVFGGTSDRSVVVTRSAYFSL